MKIFDHSKCSDSELLYKTSGYPDASKLELFDLWVRLNVYAKDFRILNAEGPLWQLPEIWWIEISWFNSGSRPGPLR